MTYKEDKKVLIGNYDCKIIVDDGVRKAISDNGNFKLSEDEKYLIAVKPGKLSLTCRWMQGKSYPHKHNKILLFPRPHSTHFADWVNAAGDYELKTLPLSKEDQKDYVNPKLEYYDNDLSCIITDQDFLTFLISQQISNKTSLASIDKKGKLKLNGVGEVDVVVRDKNTGLWAYKTFLDRF